MKILIVGSKGFIGSHCVAHFKDLHEIWECDVATDYTTPNYYQVISNNATYNELFQEHKFDVCINCSGAASVPDSLQNPFRDFELNTNNVFKLLEAIRKYNPKCKFINLSSAAVYGNPPSLPITETSIAKPISPYGMHKYYAEQICKEYFKYFQCKTASLRIFSAYGPGLKKQLFWDLNQKCKASDNISLFGTGKESRDFIFIKDIINAIELVIHNSNFKGDIINIASGVETTIEEVVKCFLKELNFKGEYKFSGGNRKGDPKNWRADISILQQMGFAPNYNIQLGLKEYVKWINLNY